MPYPSSFAALLPALLLLACAGLCPAAAPSGLSVEAVVVAQSGQPKPMDVMPYRHGLMLDLWRVQTGIPASASMPAIAAGSEIAVAHWGIVDAAFIARTRKVGDRARLTLLPWDDHPEVHGLFLRNNLPNQGTGRAWFIDIGDPAAPKDLDAITRPRPSVALPDAVRRAAAAPGSAAAPARSKAIAETTAALADQERSHGGWKAWEDALAAWRTEIRAVHKSQRYDRSGFWFGGIAIEALLSSDYEVQAENPRTMLVALHRQLAAQGIDLLVAPIPNKEDIFPERLSAKAPADRMVSLATTKLLAHLAADGVEVLDLFALYRAHRLAKPNEDIWQPGDSHWNHRGQRLAAEAIAARVRRYAFAEVAAGLPPLWTSVDATVPGTADLIADPRTKADFATRFPVAYRAIRDPLGNPYQDIADAPVLLLGDSFARFLLIEGGSLSAQIAYALNCPLSFFGRPGFASQTMPMLREPRAPALHGRRVVVWTAVARSFAGSSKSTWPVMPLYP